MFFLSIIFSQLNFCVCVNFVTKGGNENMDYTVCYFIAKTEITIWFHGCVSAIFKIFLHVHVA